MNWGFGSVQLSVPTLKPPQLVTASTSQPERSQLNVAALLNIDSIFVTLDVSHPMISWLKSVASRNIPFIVSTFEVVNELIAWLKLDA